MNRSNPLPIHKFPNLIDEVAKLKELEAKATPDGWIKATQPEYDADYETADRLVGGPTGRDEYDREVGIFSNKGEWPSVCVPEMEIDADFIADMRNAAPDLLAVLDGFQAGDADILYWMLTGVGDEPNQDDIVGLLSRYHGMAQAMEATR